MSGYDTEFEYNVTINFVDATTLEATSECQELGFSNHGLVIRSAEGDVLFSQPDHDVMVDDVHTKLIELLGDPAG